jgi:hypothetical protein
LEAGLMDYELAYRLQLEKLIHIAQSPQWKAWAWDYAKQLAADKSGVFKGIDDDLAKAMKELKK